MITGKYVISSNGKILAEFENMITANGLTAINSYLTGVTRDWAGTIAVGTLNSIPTSSGTQILQYEIARYPTSFKSYRNVSGVNQIVLKTTLDPGADFDIYEIGVFPAKVDPSNYFDNYKISTFSEINASSSMWVINGIAATTTLLNPSPRSGGYMVNLPITNSSTTSTASMGTLNFDSYLFTDSDTLNLLYYSASNVTNASVTVIFGDSSTPQNTWSSSVAIIPTAPSGAFYSVPLAMGTRSASLLDPLISASVTVLGSGSILMDHLKFVSSNTLTTDLQLVSRTVSSTTTSPIFSKQYSQPMDIEYYIQVT
jgi:hypothetical protein